MLNQESHAEPHPPTSQTGSAIVVTPPDIAAAERYADARLRSELDPRFVYHSYWHSVDEVTLASIELARLEGLGPLDTLLIRTASLFHDVGFVIRRDLHEEAGIEIARAALPDFGYSVEQIDAVAGMILATRLPQRPITPCERVVADADLDVLGRDDFCPRNRLLLQELRAFGQEFSDERWRDVQTTFLSEHRYFTASARAMRDRGKARNLAGLADCYPEAQ
jgi:uncharacterized protein